MGHWNSIIINQTVQTLRVKHSDNETRDRQLTAGIIVEKAGTYGAAVRSSPITWKIRTREDEILVKLDYRDRPCNLVEIMPRLDGISPCQGQGRDEWRIVPIASCSARTRPSLDGRAPSRRDPRPDLPGVRHPTPYVELDLTSGGASAPPCVLIVEQDLVAADLDERRGVRSGRRKAATHTVCEDRHRLIIAREPRALRASQHRIGLGVSLQGPPVSA